MIRMKIEANNTVITRSLAESAIYIKMAMVKATQLTAEGLAADAYTHLDVRRDDELGYVVDTYVMSETGGKRVPKLEASQPVAAGDWIITNPQKLPTDRPNNYGKKDASFRARYKATPQPGVYMAKGLTRVAKNPTGVNIEMVAYWDDVQYGDAECYIAAPVDPKNLDDLGEGQRYLLDAIDFRETYRPVSEVLGTDWRKKILE